MSPPRVAIFAPAPVLVCTFEHPADRSSPDVALNVGGQGPWVARAVTALGADAVLVVPLGGNTGQAAGHLLSEEPHDVRAVDTKAAIACYVEERLEGERRCIREAPPGRFGQRELDQLYSVALTAGLDADVCIITGSPWADHLDTQLLTRLTTDLASLGRTTVADLSGRQLEAALAGGVDWVKIADDEVEGPDPGAPVRVGGGAEAGAGAGADAGTGTGGGEAGSGNGEARLWAEAERLAQLGVRRRNVIISRAAADATLVLTTEGRHRVAGPALTTVDSRGSGDAMTAALATGLAEHRSMEDVLRRAVAAGAANAVHRGSATPDPRLVDRLARTVVLTDATAPR